MPTPISIWIPLGLIVDTDPLRSRTAFQKLFAQSGLGIDVDALLRSPYVEAKFLKFNMGRYTSEQAFADDLLLDVESFIPLSAMPIRGYDQKWYKEWKGCWNAQSTVNFQTLILLHMIAANDDPDVEIVIFSETNSAHYEQFRAKCIADKVNLGKLNLYTSHLSLMSIDQMMLAHAEANLDKKHIRIKRDPALITDPDFKRMASKKEERIAIMLHGHGVETKVISETQLKPESLQAIIADFRAPFRQSLSLSPPPRP